MIERVLKQYGMSEKEVDVYLQLTELGQAPVSAVARKLGQNRVTVYSILKKLENEWVVHSIQKWNTAYYAAVSPEVLIEKVDDLRNDLETVLPTLMAMSHKHGNKPKAKLYDGIQWLKTAYNEIVASSEKSENREYLCFTGAAEIDPEFEKYLLNEFKSKRMKKDFVTKAIVTKADTAYNTYTKQNHEYIEIDSPLFELWNEIVLYDSNKVAVLMYWSWEMSALIIESVTLHNGLKSMFQFMWSAYQSS